MINFKLTKESYLTLKTIDLKELGNDVILNDTSFMVSVNNLDILQIIINEQIVTDGMINQDDVNEYGKELYYLYDEILFKIKECT